jgi:hypothetical protein
MKNQKFEIGSEWKCRNGTKATVICNNLKGGYPIACKVDRANCYNQEMIRTYDDNGTHCELPEFDLIEKWREKIKVEGWVLIMESGRIFNTEIFYRQEGAQIKFDILIEDYKKGILTDKPIAIIFVRGEDDE